MYSPGTLGPTSVHSIGSNIISYVSCVVHYTRDAEGVRQVDPSMTHHSAVSQSEERCLHVLNIHVGVKIFLSPATHQSKTAWNRKHYYHHHHLLWYCLAPLLQTAPAFPCVFFFSWHHHHDAQTHHFCSVEPSHLFSNNHRHVTNGEKASVLIFSEQPFWQIAGRKTMFNMKRCPVLSRKRQLMLHLNRRP